MGRTLSAVLFVIYIIIGVVVASGHHYFEHLEVIDRKSGSAGMPRPIVSAVLAVLLWPLVLLGVNLHLK